MFNCDFFIPKFKNIYFIIYFTIIVKNFRKNIIMIISSINFMKYIEMKKTKIS